MSHLCMCSAFRSYWLSTAPISVPLGAPALSRSLPGGQPEEISEVDAAVGVADDGWREADEISRAHDQPFGVDAHAVFPPAVRISRRPCRCVWSLSVPAKERLLVKMCVPSSNLMFSSPLSHEVLLVTVMLPGLELKVMPCFLLPKAIERLMM